MKRNLYKLKILNNKYNSYYFTQYQYLPKRYILNQNSNNNIISKFNFKKFLNNPEEFFNNQNRSSLIEDIKISTQKKLFFGKFSYFQPVLEYIQIYTGLPYWEVIVLTSILLRLSLIPFYYISHKEDLKFQKYSDEINLLTRKIKTSKTDDEKTVNRSEHYKFLQKKNITQWKKLATLVQLPVFIPMFMSLRKMSTTVELFKSGGFLWFKNLSIPDPYFILPIVNSLLIFLNFKLNSKNNPNLKSIPNWLIGGSVILTTLFTAKLNSCFFMFWIPLQVINLLQSTVFQSIKKKNLIKLEKAEEEKVDESFTILDTNDKSYKNDKDY